MPRRTAKRIFQAIQAANKVLLVPHKNPDGDTLGSVAAMMQYLRRIHKPHVAFCATDISPKLRFLPHIEYITEQADIWQDTDIDLIIVFDSGDLGYAGIDTHVASMAVTPTIVNIDHHNTNESFGDLNLVIAHASSTTEILYHFFLLNEVSIDADIATCLLTGLVTDTGNFTNAATTASSLDIAGDLIRRGGNLDLINGWIFRDKSLRSLRLWGAILNRIAKHDDLDIVYTYVTRKDLEEHNVSEHELEELANFLNSIEEGRAGMILKEKEDGTFKGSFRTTHDHVDVSAFAKLFGGGGHKKAAGFTVEGPLELALDTVFGGITQLEAVEK